MKQESGTVKKEINNSFYSIVFFFYYDQYDCGTEDNPY